MKRLLLIVALFTAATAWGVNACPGGQFASDHPGVSNCYYISTSGLDTSTGADEAHSWLHAPGMPGCSSNCLTKQNSHPQAGDGFIIRGGDVYHFGNSGATPFINGTWDIYNISSFNNTNDTNCQYEGTQTGCHYWGVDKTWFSGGSWTRPVLDGDNPISSAGLVSSCTYQITTSLGVPAAHNTMVSIPADAIFDNFELRGLCSQLPVHTSTVFDTFVAFLGTGVSGRGLAFETNLYVHGWSAAYVVRPSIVSAVRTSGTVRVTTTAANGYKVGDGSIGIAGLTDATFNHDQAVSPITVTAIDATSHLWFEYADARADASCTGACATNGLATGNTDPINAFSGGQQGLTTFDHEVLDGSDSLPGISSFLFPSFFHLKDSIFRYISNGIGQWCHDVHDNIFEFSQAPYFPTHGNILECNHDAYGNAVNQPQNTPNVFYNNIVRHSTTAFSTGGNVGIWLTPNNLVDEYWWNNIVYDIGDNSNSWAIDFTTDSGQSGATTQHMFNNTLVDLLFQPCNTGVGTSLVILNEHLINTVWQSNGHVGNCPTSGDTSNISMTGATAITQGYGSNTGQINTQQAGSINCANDTTTPCSPTSGGATIAAGKNEQSYCTTLASFSGDPAIGTDAANACKYGTTDGCTYDNVNHAMVCPAQTAVVRPLSAAWDAGAYQFTGGTTYTLGVTLAGAGTGSVSSSPAGISCGGNCSASFSSGASMVLTESVTGANAFTLWAGATCTEGNQTSSTCSFTLSADTTVTATFVPTYVLTVTRAGAGSGSVSSSPSGITCGATCSASFNSGASVTLTATPTGNNIFAGWSGACGGTSTCVLTMSAAKAVTATFVTARALSGNILIQGNAKIQ